MIPLTTSGDFNYLSVDGTATVTPSLLQVGVPFRRPDLHTLLVWKVAQAVSARYALLAD